MQVPVDDVTNIEVETLLIESSQYTLYPDFQAWFDVGEAELSREDLRDFPYDLKELQQAANFGARVANDKTLYGVNGFRSTPEDTEELRQEMGLRQRGGEMDVEIWTSGSSIYFPLRIKASTKNFTPKESLTLIYSDIGEVVHLSVPEEVLNINYFDRLMVGDLDTAEVGQLVRALPVQGQNCVEEEVGIDLYRELVAGVGQADLSVQDAFLACNKAIFPVSLDHLKGAIPEYLPFRHLSAFSVTRDS